MRKQVRQAFRAARHGVQWWVPAIAVLLATKVVASDGVLSPSAKVATDVSAVPDSSFILARKAVETLEARALEGDADAAGKLFRHFSASRSSREASYWLQIAVENGDPSSIKTHAVRLWVSGGKRNCLRALALTRKLASSKSVPRYADQVDVSLMVKGLSECIAKAPQP